MTLLIGTDEAGYGPPLGPLVIVATVWRFRSEQTPEEAFSPLAEGLQLSDGTRLAIGDSKQLFKPRAAAGLAALEATITEFAHAMQSGGWSSDTPPRTLGQLLMHLCRDDWQQLRACPWYADLDVPYPLGPDEDAERHSMVRCCLADAGLEMVDLAARVIDAPRFNRLCEAAGNKATVLSEATTALVASSIERRPDEPVIHVYSDRHGGRHRYGALLQHACPDAMLTVVKEGSPESRYRLTEPHRHIDWRFSIKGDRFAPVAMASMVAKYLRERLMERFNAFWQSHHGATLRPTAGYPTDAVRFCEQIGPTAQRLGLKSETYVRIR